MTDSASSAPPAGMVVFSGNGTTAFIGGTSSCSLTPDASGVMSCVAGAVPAVAGTAPITATYQGDAAHAKSQGATNLCAGTAAACAAQQQQQQPTATGKSKCILPKVAGKSLSQAQKLIKKAGCAIGRVTRPRARKGHKLGVLIVARINPGAGTSVANGTKVAIVLKEKPAPKPKPKPKRKK